MSAGKKTVFPCGHVGKGQYCHVCAQKEKEARLRALKQSEWREALAESPVSLAGLPREIALKALETVKAIEGGQAYQSFKGKRLARIPGIISIPIGHRYRMVLRAKAGAREYLGVVSHEKYNTLVSSRAWARRGACVPGM